MKIKYLLLLGLIAALSSCSSAYRTGQTPDDVYYSPAPAQDTYVKTDNQQDRDSYYNRNEEQEIRRGIQDSRYRSNVTLSLGYGYSPYAYDPFGYYYNPYAYNSYGTFGSPYGYKGFYDPYGYNSYSYNPYSYNNFGYNYGYNYYNPYYGSYYPPVYIYPGIGNTTTNNGPRRVNLGAYNNTGTNANTGRISNPNTRSNNGSAPVRTFNQSENRQTGVGNVIRRVFTPSSERTYTTPTTSNSRRTYNNDNNNTRNTNPTPARTFDNTPSPSTSTPSSSGSSSSGSAPVRTFKR
jgi:hypothetical protein